MSQIFIQQIPREGAATTAARVSTAQLVGEARRAVQVATKTVAIGAASGGEAITPPHSGTYVNVQAVQAADGSTEYVKFRD